MHGVRSEFLVESGDIKSLQNNIEGEKSKNESNGTNGDDAGCSDQVKPDAVQDDGSRMNLTSVYFIGKLLWAKG
ncbi:MAG: hypothetical protein ACREBR_03040 [bacterium]